MQSKHSCNPHPKVKKMSISQFAVANRIGLQMSQKHRIQLVESIFESLDKAGKQSIFISMVKKDLSILDALSLIDNFDEEVEEEKPVVKKPAAKKPVVKKVVFVEEEEETVEEEEETKLAAEEEEELVTKTSFITIVKKETKKPDLIPTRVAAKSRPTRVTAKVESSHPTAKKEIKTKVSSVDEMNDLISKGKMVCGFAERGCNNPRCKFIHPDLEFMCLKYGNCMCKKAHLKDFKPSAKYNTGTRYIVDTQEEYDDAIENGIDGSSRLVHCTGGDRCFRACSFLHIAKGKQCLDPYCEDQDCDLVHVAYCRTMYREGVCDNWDNGKCGCMH